MEEKHEALFLVTVAERARKARKGEAYLTQEVEGNGESKRGEKEKKGREQGRVKGKKKEHQFFFLTHPQTTHNAHQPHPHTFSIHSYLSEASRARQKHYEELE